MFVDAQSLDDDSRLKTDVCIVGAGPAGISAANQLRGAGVDCVLVESGGLSVDPDIQSLSKGDVVGLHYRALDFCRARVFGGNGTLWRGATTPLDDIDFAERDWVPGSGWPIGKANLQPFYDAARGVMRVGPDMFDERTWRYLGMEPFLENTRSLTTQFWQFSPLQPFGQPFRKVFAAAATLKVLLNATVTNLQVDALCATVDTVKVRSKGGKSIDIAARIVILACGAMENARILLLSRDIAPAGLGNGNDLVGRFYMDHPHVPCALLKSTDLRRILEVAGVRSRKNGTWFRPIFRLADEVQRQEQVLNCSATFEFVSEVDVMMAAFQAFQRANRSRRFYAGLLRTMMTVASRPRDSFFQLYRYYLLGKSMMPRENSLMLYTRSEPMPSADSRVRLTDELDANGQNRIALDWRLNLIDKRTILVMANQMAAELRRMGLGDLEILPWVQDGTNDWPADLLGGLHHMGTTRMSADPRSGVVDRDCRVHGIGNLYVAGASVFPTVGWANPTMTVVALALRLASHVTDLLAAPVTLTSPQAATALEAAQ
jgi:choline dehydrogenase-like flavoprotein